MQYREFNIQIGQRLTKIEDTNEKFFFYNKKSKFIIYQFLFSVLFLSRCRCHEDSKRATFSSIWAIIEHNDLILIVVVETLSLVVSCFSNDWSNKKDRWNSKVTERTVVRWHTSTSTCLFPRKALNEKTDFKQLELNDLGEDPWDDQLIQTLKYLAFWFDFAVRWAYAWKVSSKNSRLFRWVYEEFMIK
jgi:hypothetical protein